MPRIDVWPDIQTDDAGAVTIFYRAGWNTIEDDSERISVPEWVELLYLQLVRAVARGYEREDETSMTLRLMEVQAGPVWAAAMKQDSEMQPDYGPLRNGAAELARIPTLSHFWNTRTTLGPT